MTAYLIYSQDPYLKEVFLHMQIGIHKPQQVLRYSLNKVKFKEVAEKIFNFSLFGNKTIYFLEDAQTLDKHDLEFLQKVDFRQLKDVYIFCLGTFAYWKELPKWEGISGLVIKELRFTSSQEIKKYLEELISRQISGRALNLISSVYEKEKDFKMIIDAVTKASLYQPQGEELSFEILEEFLGEREPGEINILYTRIKNKDLTHALSCLQTLVEKGFKQEAIFSILIYKFTRDSQLHPSDLKFILELERRQKSQKVDIFLLLVELVFYFCQRDVLALGLGLET